MPRIATSMMIVVAAGAAGCTAASATPFDSGDPVHCLTIFGATSGVARQGTLADELNARIVHIVRSNGGVAWLNRVSPVSRQLAAGWEASPDREAAIKLFDGCRSRQDADPAFRAALPQLMREGRAISASAR